MPALVTRPRTRHSRGRARLARGSECFDDVTQQSFPFEVSYSTDEFLALIDTYASHRGLDAARRQRLHDRLRSAIDDELGGHVTKPYDALLVMGHRRP